MNKTMTEKNAQDIREMLETLIDTDPDQLDGLGHTESEELERLHLELGLRTWRYLLDQIKAGVTLYQFRLEHLIHFVWEINSIEDYIWAESIDITSKELVIEVLKERLAELNW